VTLGRWVDAKAEVQPMRAEQDKNWGIADTDKPARGIHFIVMQPWRVARDGSLHDAMFA